MLRVVEARQSEVAARAAGLPTLGGTGSYMREQIGAKGVLESTGAIGQIEHAVESELAAEPIQPRPRHEAGSAAAGC